MFPCCRLRPTTINTTTSTAKLKLNQSSFTACRQSSALTSSWLSSPCAAAAAAAADTANTAAASLYSSPYSTFNKQCKCNTVSWPRQYSYRKRSTSNSTSTFTCTRQYSNTPHQRQQGQEQKTALVLGSSGSLGSAVASQLKNYHDCVVIGSDLYPPSEDRVGCIDAFIQLGEHDSDDITVDQLIHGLQDGIANLYSDAGGSGVELDAIICASGGFAMDDDGNADGDGDGDGDGDSAGAGGKVYQDMLKMNYYPVVAAGEIAKQHMTTSNQGLFVVIGAAAALSPAPGMVAYASSKVAAHYYVKTLGAMTGRALKKEHKVQRKSEVGLDVRRKNICLDSMTALALLPIMLNTQANREALPEEDFSNWTEPSDIANEIGTWLDTPAIRPHSGSLVKVSTEDNETEFTLAR